MIELYIQHDPGDLPAGVSSESDAWDLETLEEAFEKVRWHVANSRVLEVKMVFSSNA